MTHRRNKPKAKKMTMQERFIEDMKRCRHMDFPRLGMMVEVSGQIGTIKGMNSSANLDIIFANQQKMGAYEHNCHPTWDIKYFDTDGELIVAYGITHDNKPINKTGKHER